MGDWPSLLPPLTESERREVEAGLTEADAQVRALLRRMADLYWAGVTSIATDPQWADGGEDRFREYWHSTVVGALTPSAQVRRDALARLLPRMAIADRVTLADRYPHVRGNLRGYRIHLGSGTIMMEPNDAYLCIVPARGGTGRLHLPFDDDPMLSTILSKVIMLAADDMITDPTVLRQFASSPTARQPDAGPPRTAGTRAP
ncbi:hypothetical protein ACFY1S_25490 [Micromonospora sp. NPDC000663]|uniref:DUF7737 domain-containing protein n=1 Tax=Micromonospora sp. NPDC000663 TaxID=3364218 RepID=UPI0036B1EC84